MPEYIKAIPEVIISLNKLVHWRYIALLIAGLLALGIWCLPEILAAIANQK